MSHDIIAERSVLGSMALTADAVFAVLPFVNADSFFVPGHQILFRSICEIAQRGAEVDIVTLGAMLRSRVDQKGDSDLVKCGGLDYVVQIMEFCPSWQNAVHYAKIVRDHEAARVSALAFDAEAFIRFATEFDGDSTTARVAYTRMIADKTESISSRGEFGLVCLGDLIKSKDEAMLDAHERGIVSNGDACGFPSVDAEVGGMVPGWHYIIGAYSAMGKTAFLFKLITESARISGKPWLFVSLEMTQEDLMGRFTARFSGISTPRQWRGDFNEREYNQWQNGAGDYLKAPLYIVDDPDVTMQGIRTLMEAIVAKHGFIGGVALDYVQLMAARTGERRESTAIDSIAYGMKALAKTFKCSAVTLSQINRSGLGDVTNPRKPTMADLKGSGGIEASADVVMLLHRERRENENPRQWHPMDVILAKHRFGQAGREFKLQFLPYKTDFRELEIRQPEKLAI